MTDVPDDLFAAVRARSHQLVREVIQRRPESVTARDSDGATALHYATENGDREIVAALLEAGADINARDLRFGATPAGWAIEYLRQRGGLLGIEIEDAKFAIVNGDEPFVRRYLSRFPALRNAVDRNGTTLKQHAKDSGNQQISHLFDAG